MDESQVRAWTALELGPLWQRREPSLPAQPEPTAGALPEPTAGALPEPTAVALPEPIAAAMMPQSISGARPGVEVLDQAAAPLDEPPSQNALPSRVLADVDWDGLEARVRDCQACGLCARRRHTVFGVGPRQARWMVVGEGPGAEEDASGEPFVGQAGRLLDAMLAAVDLDRRRNVFIANVVKCRPPGNRNPAPDEVASCLPFLHRQIELLAPDFVLLLGRVAAHALLPGDAGVGSLRGRVHQIALGGRSIPAVVTWHPSYLLRRPEEKALAWKDLCLARSVAHSAR